MPKADSQPRRKWPRLRMFGCSRCGQLAVSSGSHWCRGEWVPFFDTIIRYDAVGETARP